MTLSQYRDTVAWQGAIALGPLLVKLAEELPEAEQFGLGQQLRQLMVELPGVVAMDLVDGGAVRLHVALRLAAMLELIERIYPALDAAAAKTGLSELTERLASDAFTERVNIAAPVLAEVAEPEAVDDAAAAEPAASVLTVDDGEAHTVHVQPDSGQ